jgi:uncharacterized tellurite resistance protein B-like protein
MHASVERWLGVLATGVLRDRADEDAILAAARIVGEDALASLRQWFAEHTPVERQFTQCAVIEGCVAMVHADRVVTDAERDQLRALIDASQIDDAHAERMKKTIDQSPRPLDHVVAGLAHPVLRELLLVLAWELANVDGKLDEAERGTYGLLAARLGVAPERAQILRNAFAPA